MTTATVDELPAQVAAYELGLQVWDFLSNPETMDKAELRQLAVDCPAS
jgi:hypothetical protein